MRRGTMTIAAAVALVLLAVAPAGATEYFVSKSGDDGAGGQTEQAAFATIAKGVSVLKPGDTLTILPGHYFETVTARCSGTPESPTTIRAQRPGTVLLRGDVDVSGFQLVEGTRHTYSVDFDRRAEGVADRNSLSVYEPIGSVEEVERELGVYFQDDTTKRLYVHTADSAHPDQNALAVSVTDGSGLYLPPNSHDVIVDGLAFTGYSTREFPSGPGSNNRWGLCVDTPSERITVRRCVAFLNSGGIFLSGPSDAVVEDCYAFSNFGKHQELGNNILGWSVHNTVFRRNKSEDFPPLSPTWAGYGTSRLTFYGGARGDKKDVVGTMENNLVVNGGLMIKGAYADSTTQRNNSVVGNPANYFRTPDASNILVAKHEAAAAGRIYVDPIACDFRLQSDAPNRGKGPDGADPGPFPYRDEVFFVSPAGDDGKAGTSVALAWKTLARAAKTAKAGQTVYVLEGTYREALLPASSGAPGKPIRFLRRGRDRVVLDGGGKLPVGVDLAGRSHIQIKGLTIRNFAKTGLRAEKGENLQVEQVLALDNGGAGVSAGDVKGFTFQGNLLRGNKRGGLHLKRSPNASLGGNIFDRNTGFGLSCDAASLEGLYSDCNAFPPSATPAAVLDANPLPTLADWQGKSSQDAHSVAAEPGYRDAAGGDFGLRPDSALIGRGPQARPIGPFMRIPEQSPLAVKNLTASLVTPGTAVIECWTPEARGNVTLEWGEAGRLETAAELANVASTPAIFHSVGLAGLTPGKSYTVRAKAAGDMTRYRWAPYATAESAKTAADHSAVVQFQTPAHDAPPRELHVAMTGNDRASGLSKEAAWRTISHAATEARPGDTVLIHEGTYQESVLVRVTGDREKPIVFRAAPGETVWMDGNRSIPSAFVLEDKHHIILDGLRFRHFGHVSHIGGCINLRRGSGHVVRRCFYDGREANGTMAIFLRGRNTADLLVENCVAIFGMGVGVSLDYCVHATVRHCVFYNNFIQALDVIQWNLPPWNSQMTVDFSHNLVCDTIPTKTANPFMRISHLDALRSDHNGYFARQGAAERKVVESFFFQNQPLGPNEGKYGYWTTGKRFLLEELQKFNGQEQHSIFGNPGIRAVGELTPSGRESPEFWKNEMHRSGATFDPLDFSDFFCDPQGPMGKAADGKPIGLDPAAFR